MLLPTEAGSGSRPAGGSAEAPRGVPGNDGARGTPGAPPPSPAAGATMTGRLIGATGNCSAAEPTPGRTSITDGSPAGGISSGGNCIRGGSSGRPGGIPMTGESSFGSPGNPSPPEV